MDAEKIVATVKYGRSLKIRKNASLIKAAKAVFALKNQPDFEPSGFKHYYMIKALEHIMSLLAWGEDGPYDFSRALPAKKLRDELKSMFSERAYCEARNAEQWELYGDMLKIKGLITSYDPEQIVIGTTLDGFTITGKLTYKDGQFYLGEFHLDVDLHKVPDEFDFERPGIWASLLIMAIQKYQIKAA